MNEKNDNESSNSEVPWFDGTVEIALSDLKKPPPVPREEVEPCDVGKCRPVEVPGRSWLIDKGEFARGGMSMIHEVAHRNLRVKAVMKILNSTHASDELGRKRFIEEAQITSQLEHPHIPPVHDLWMDPDGNIRFTMKLVEGRTLKEILDESSLENRVEKDWEDLLKIFLKVCDAVSYAHSHGVIHRDLKTDNVMVGTHGQVWVMDWGCAFVMPHHSGDAGRTVSLIRDPEKETLDPPETAIGTASYMAPEQARALTDEMDERTDVYLLGGILYEILTGHPPHRGKDIIESIRMAQRGEVKEPAEIVTDRKLPPVLCQIAMNALASDRYSRYASVDELREEIEDAIRSGWWFTTVTYPAGHIIVKEGDRADAAYIITRGVCEVYRIENDTRVSLRRMGPGEAFGETAIFTKKTRTANVEVIEPMTAMVITKDAFDRAIGSSWMRPFLRALAERFQEHDEMLSYIRSKSD